MELKLYWVLFQYIKIREMINYSSLQNESKKKKEAETEKRENHHKDKRDQRIPNTQLFPRRRREKQIERKNDDSSPEIVACFRCWDSRGKHTTRRIRKLAESKARMLCTCAGRNLLRILAVLPAGPNSCRPAEFCSFDLTLFPVILETGAAVVDRNC